MDTDKDVLLRALALFGEQFQLGMLTEETGELLTAVSRYTNRGRGTVDDIATEIADVMIILREIAIIFNIEDKVSIEYTNKMDRLKRRVEAAESRLVVSNPQESYQSKDCVGFEQAQLP